jgi:predicted SPOUT superfamily RNA methylase MTH1
MYVGLYLIFVFHKLTAKHTAAICKDEPEMSTKYLAIAVPASMISDTPHLREKTAKIGVVGRAAAIFQVNEIIVYPDSPTINQKSDLDLIVTLLNYMETPQYLRKLLFELEPDLQCAGILPPLRTPHHPLLGKFKDLKVGDYREGVTISKTREGTIVDIGSERPVVLKGAQLPINKRVTIKITRLSGQVEVQQVNLAEVPFYWGYTVSTERRSLGKLLESGNFDLTVGTSRFAPRFQEVAETLSERWKKANNILILFGAPSKGLHEIAEEEGTDLNRIVDFVINTVPNQGTETIRTEEALLATLAILNVQFDF